MRYRKIGDSYVIRLEKGEKVIGKLEEFCEKNGIKSGHFSGIGGLSEAEIAHFSIEEKDYHSKVFRGSVLELISLQGNVTVSEGKLKVHAHVVIGDKEFRTSGGHLMEGTVLPTCEIVFFPFEETIKRTKDGETGLALLDL
ncbi:MAG: DNA-binding protein [Candidatus Aenigmatarchaeota archaeon]|nr:MAG: DNA-binding protein [Candidatus Aenigmarchaeota archaeon]